MTDCSSLIHGTTQLIISNNNNDATLHPGSDSASVIKPAGESFMFLRTGGARSVRTETMANTLTNNRLIHEESSGSDCWLDKRGDSK